MNPLDYSKWNKLDISDDDSDFESETGLELFEKGCSLGPNSTSAFDGTLAAKAAALGGCSDNDALASLGLPNSSWDFVGIPAALPGMSIRKPKLSKDYVGSPIQRIQYSEAWRAHRRFFEQHPHMAFDPKIQIHLRDKAADIHPIFFTDPFRFEPKTKDGVYVEWGIQDVYNEFMAFNLRRLTTQVMYGSDSTDSDLVEFEPAVQFVNALAYKKELEIFSYRRSKCTASKKSTVKVKGNIKVVASPEIPRDFVLDVSIRNVHPRVWRRIKVSSGLSLSVFHDKILCPCFGW
ncbi:hypothetical protein HDV03_002293, partial [Kappamyces sp. JEL0829]